jgi:hypothetical protein
MYSVLENMSGIQDIGEPGIDAEDFAGEQGAANMTILRKEMLNTNNPASKKMFIDWQTEELRKHHGIGKARYDKVQRGKGSGSGGDKPTSLFQGYQGKGWVPGSSQETWFGNFTRRESFQGHYDSYNWDGSNYINSGGESMSLWDVAQAEHITANLPMSHEIFQSSGSTSLDNSSILSIEPKMFRGTEKEVVKSFNNDPRFEGYEFTTEWELGGRAMNIIIGNNEEIIMLDEKDAAAKILKFIKNNPTTSTQQTITNFG